MRSELEGYSYDEYDQALAAFEAAQSMLLNKEDIAEAARMAGGFALVAAEIGNINMAESGHRTVIHACKLMEETEALKLDPDEIVTVHQKRLAEYARLAETLGHSSKSVATHHKLHRLKKEVLGVCPVAPEHVVDGIWALHETEKSLSNLAVIRNKAHSKRSLRLRNICEIASMSSGLGLRMISSDNIQPRSIRQWIKTIERSGIV